MIVVGARKRLRAVFRDDDSAYLDPDTVTFFVRSPGRPATSYVYGGGALVRDSAGQYHLDITLDRAGTWYYTLSGVVSSLGATLSANGSISVQAAAVT